MTQASDKTLLVDQLSAAMDALSSVVGQHVEVVLHDVSQPASSVLKIINGHVSGRTSGSSILSGPDDDQGFLGLLEGNEAKQSAAAKVFKDYQTTSVNGKPLRSATVMYNDSNGQPSIALCFNADYSAVDTAQRVLGQLIPATAASTDANGSTLEDKMNDIIRAAMPPAGVMRVGASKKEKVEVVRRMQEKGLFIVRGGVERAAKVLGVTRYTIYNYLDEVKK